MLTRGALIAAKLSRFVGANVELRVRLALELIIKTASRITLYAIRLNNSYLTWHQDGKRGRGRRSRAENDTWKH